MVHKLISTIVDGRQKPRKNIESHLREDGIKSAERHRIPFDRYLKYLASSSILVLAVGSLLSIINSHANDLPFRVLSIVQCAAICVYCAGIIASFMMLKYLIVNIIKVGFKDSSRPLRKLLLAAIIIVAPFTAFLAVLSYLLNDICIATIVCVLYYGIGTIVLWHVDDSKSQYRLIVSWGLLWCLILIILLPMNLGGFRSRKVEYCAYEDNQVCQEYNYYGTSEGFYQFIEKGEEGEKHVILAPTDSGYIRYKQEKSKLFGLIEL